MRGVSGADRVCDRDCFHCPYPDCVVDDITAQEAQELAAINKYLTLDPKKEKLAAQKRAWYQANKDKLAAQRRAKRTGKRGETLDMGACTQVADLAD